MGREVIGEDLTPDILVLIANLTRIQDALFDVDECYAEIDPGWGDRTRQRRRLSASQVIEAMKELRWPDKVTNFHWKIFDDNVHVFASLGVDTLEFARRYRLSSSPSSPSAIEPSLSDAPDLPQAMEVDQEECSREHTPPASDGEDDDVRYRDTSDVITARLAELEAAKKPPVRVTMRPKRVPLRYILAAWAVECNIRTSHMTKLLKRLKVLPDSVFKELPQDGRTLMRDMRKLKHAFRLIPVWEKLTAANRFRKESSAKGNPINADGEERIGYYVHFGIKRGILLDSPGCFKKHSQLKEMRKGYVVNPRLYNGPLFEATKAPFGFEDDWEEVVSGLEDTLTTHQNVKPHEKVTVMVDINYDGVSIAEQQAEKPHMWPVLGCITGLKGGGEHLKFSHAMPTFIVGYFIGSRKPSANTILQHVADEFIALHPSTNEGPVSVELDAAIADAPALADMTGTVGPTGYYGLHRCSQRGIHVEFAKKHNLPYTQPTTVDEPDGPALDTIEKKKAFIRFNKTRCYPRSHANWLAYEIRDRLVS